MEIINRIGKLNWITQLLLPLSIILMEALWLYSWLVWLSKWQTHDVQRPPLSLASLVLLLGASFLTTQFFLKQKWSMVGRQLSILSCGLVTIFLVLWFEYDAGVGLFDGQRFVYIGQMLLESFTRLTPLAVALAVGAYMWWRGIGWGRYRLSFDDIYHSFLLGLAAMVLLIIVWGISLGAGSLSGLATSAGIYVAGFFFCGLLALALGNLQAIQEKMAASEGAGRILNRRWLSIIFSVTFAIIIVGIGLATIFSADVLAWLGHALDVSSDWLFKGLYYILYPFGLIVQGLYYVIRFLLQFIQKGEPPEPFQFNMDMPEEAEQIVKGALPAMVVLALKWTLFAIVVGLVLFLLAKAVRHFWSFRDKDDIEEVNESLWSWGGFWTDLRLLFSLLRKRFERTKRTPVATKHRTEEAESRLNIREIYQRLLQEASRLMIPRQRNETPYEYARRLYHTIPEGKEHVGELTNLYVNVRYGDLATEEKQIDFANVLWRALKSLLRKLEVIRAG